MNRFIRYHRYSFRQVLVVVVVFHIFLAILALTATYFSSVKGEILGMERFTRTWLFKQVGNVGFTTLFYYYMVNNFYGLMAARKNFVSYLEPGLVGFTGVVIYLGVNMYYSSKQIQISVSSGEKIESQLTLGLIAFTFTISALFFIGLSLLIAYLSFLRDEKKQRKILEEQKMQLEIEKSQANLNFLKAQINPHFLHNTLNFLYAKSLPYSAELSEGILTLSDIMRYALSEGNARDGKAPLRDEIEHVRNVIKINQLRFSNNLKVHFEVNGVVNGATIIPFVLITIVENAFKHGDLKSAEHPIEIRLDIHGHRMQFFCRNRKKTGPKELSTGIGLHNIKKQLELAYGASFSLQVKDEAEFYTTELIIDPI